jgi:hypothetical protein
MVFVSKKKIYLHNELSKNNKLLDGIQHVIQTPKNNISILEQRRDHFLNGSLSYKVIK